MATIESWADLVSVETGITTEQIDAIIQSIDVRIYNIINGYGDFGAAEYEEQGDVGHRIDPSKALAQLRELRKMYVDLRNDPIAMQDFAELRSQWDDPGL